MNFDKENIIWQKVCDKFKQTNSEAVFNSWLKPLEISHAESGVIYLKSPSKFIKNWVNNNYKSKINSYLNCFEPTLYSIEIIADEQKNLSVVSNQNNHTEIKTAQQTKQDTYNNTKPEFTSYIDKKLSFENFIISDSNRVAASLAAKAETGIFNPLIITGGVGRGKSHLLNAIANDITESDMHKNVVCLSSERFMFLFIKSLKQNSILDFKDFVRGADVLLIDDIQFIVGKQNIAEEFLHTYDSVIARGGMVIVTCDKPIGQYDKLDERVKSRLSSGMVCNIETPDRELRIKFLQRKFAKANLALGEEIIDYLSDKITGSVRDVEGAVNRIIAQSYILNDAIDIEFLKRFFASNSFYNEKKIITIESIKRKIAEQFNIKLTELDSDKKTRQISRPRQIAMYLCKKLTTNGTSEIGRNFGNKDHSTVVNACRTTESLMQKNQEIANLIFDLEKSLG